MEVKGRQDLYFLFMFIFISQVECSKLEEKIRGLEEVKKSGEQQQRKLQESFQLVDSLKVIDVASSQATPRIMALEATMG